MKDIPLLADLSSDSPAEIAVAVSGGRDSIALLHLICERLPPQKVVVLHLDHGLRGAESDGDRIFVEGLVRDMG